MSRELVCADGELSAALNKTERYIEFLDECIREYNKILSDTAGIGIDDVLVCTELARDKERTGCSASGHFGGCRQGDPGH